MEKSLSFKEKLNIFQKSIDDVDKINITKSFDKIKSSGKKVMIFGDIKNDKKENNIYNKILQFIKEKPVFPCLLISKDDNGKIEMNMHCLKDINIDNIKLIKEEGFEITKRKDAYYYQIIDFSNFQFDISVIHNNINFSSKAKNIEKISKINNLIIGKYKLYSFNINEGELSFNSHFLKKFEEIANNSSSDQMKAKEIDEIFENQGYYIPLKIYIGGIFINRYNDKNYKLFKEDINLSGEDIRKIFNNENTQIIGGEKSEKNFELWTQSIQISNSNIIECSNIIEAKNILPNQLKEKLKKPLQLVEEKYLKRTKYIEYINSLKDIKLGEKKGYNDFSKGICKESNIPEVYKKEIYCYGDKSFGYTTKIISESFDDIIVGFNIISKRDDEFNGEWDIEFNPLLKKEIKITFVSQFIRVEKYMIYIYLMKFPE